MNALGAPANNPHELLIRVDSDDHETGFASKEECHRGEGLLHRAFSAFIFNSRGELLLQQRSAGKPLWPLHWSNSCCSHPRRGESVESAARRRVVEELAIDCTLTFLYKFQYRAGYADVGTEHELCWVYAGTSDATPAPSPAEVAAWRYVAPATLSAEIAAEPQRFTPWLKLEWAEIGARHLPRILAAATGPAPALRAR